MAPRSFPSGRRAMGALLGGALVFALFAHCRSPVNDPDSTVPGSCESSQPLIEPARTDILFVVDTSSSMREEQDAVATELPAFIAALQQGSGVAQDFNVGV